MKNLTIILIIFMCLINSVSAKVIYDKKRDRLIPVEITYPKDARACTIRVKCSVALFSAGYGVSHLEYSFLTKTLNQLGYLVITIIGVLPSTMDQDKYGSCVVKIPDSKHNDIADYGPKWLKNSIALLINNYFKGQSCAELRSIPTKQGDLKPIV